MSQAFQLLKSKISAKMYYYPDLLVLACLFSCGFVYGYYCKFTYVFDNLWIHWYSVLGILIAVILGIIWTFQKYKQRQYRFSHFYMIIYGHVCFLISGCFMLTENMDVSFYFGFIGLGTIFIPSFSYISLRCSSAGLRPMRVALGNALYFAGLTTGFSLFNEFEPRQSGWIYMGVTLTMLFGLVVNEVLQHIGVHNYKQSFDLVFNLMNDEKMVFLPTKSVYAFFTGRPEFYFTKNRQSLVVGICTLIMLERSTLFSSSFLQVTWSATFAFVSKQYLYLPFLLYTFGCFCGCVLLVRYRPKLIYLMFGLIKVTAAVALLGIYSDTLIENCFFFLCFYYIAMGVYSSSALQIILECSPFLLTEFIFAVGFSMQLFFVELLKYEMRLDDLWLGLVILVSVASAITMSCAIIIHFFVPISEGLVDMRNRLIGVRKHEPPVPVTKIWHSNFLIPDAYQRNMKKVVLNGNRVFQQYPSNEDVYIK